MSRTLPLRALACAALFAVGCAASAATREVGESPRGPVTEREDAIRFLPMRDVRAIAVGRRVAALASDEAVALYDRQFRRWLPPVPVGPGSDLSDRVTAMAVDPADETVWVGSAGSLVAVRPTLQSTQRSSVPGVVEGIWFGAAGGDGGVVQVSGRRYRLSPTGALTPPTRAETGPLTGTTSLARLYAEFPQLGGADRLLTRDAQLRSWPVVAGARAPEKSEVWLATAGGGAFVIDPFFQRSEPLVYGPLQRRLTRLLATPDGVLMIGPPAAREIGGVAQLSRDLTRWQWLDAPDRALDAGVPLALAQTGRTLWIGGEGTLVRVDRARASDPSAWRRLTGIERVTSITPRAGGVWLATPGTVRWIPESDTIEVDAPAPFTVSATSVTPVGDSLWFTGAFGIATGSRGELRVLRDARVRGTGYAAVRSDSSLFVAFADAPWRLDLRTAALTPLGAPSAWMGIGTPTAITADARILIVTGTNGATWSFRENGTPMRVTALAGLGSIGAWDVVLTAEAAWFATDAGLVRVRRLPGGGLP